MVLLKKVACCVGGKARGINNANVRARAHSATITPPTRSPRRRASAYVREPRLEMMEMIR